VGPEEQHAHIYMPHVYHPSELTVQLLFEKAQLDHPAVLFMGVPTGSNVEQVCHGHFL